MGDRNSHKLKVPKNKLFRKKSGTMCQSWRKRKLETADEREGKLLRQNHSMKEESKMEEGDSITQQRTGPPYSLSIALPGSFLNNAQSAELRTYMAGQIARAATLFCVNEVIVYDETSRMTKESIDSYWAGSWHGEVQPSDSNYESCFYLAKILEYLECPQYLRRYIFPVQRPLKYAGLLNPLDSYHHLRSDDTSIPYREGIVLDKPTKKGRGPLCDVGLEKELQIEDSTPLPPGTRVTVEITNIGEESKRYRGKLTSAKRVYEKTENFWGYKVKLAPSLKEVIDRNKYDVIIGTSPKGSSVNDLYLCTLTHTRLLLVFGGIKGVDAAFEGEEALEYFSAEEAFDHLVNCLPHKGTRSERVEENILVTLSEISMRIGQLYK